MDIDYDVIVIGGGFGGVYQLQHLRKLGFSVHLFETGSKLGGIWYWNCYPGARVDTEVPVYQIPDPDTFYNFQWEEKYPGRDALRDYFEHIDKAWDLKKDISFGSRVTACHWDNEKTRWDVTIQQVQLNGPVDIHRYCKSIIVCTGFASAPFKPHFAGEEKFKGMTYHTSAWPQEDIDVKGKRVAVIGTGASGVQVIQTIAPKVKQLTVYQRTPNYALPMGNNKLPKSRLKYYKDNYPEIIEKVNSTFAGFMYEFHPGECMKATPEEREAMFEELYNKGGLHFWLGTYSDVLFNKEANRMAYDFWRAKTIARINDPETAEKLAPKNPPHPYGTKRVSLETGYFEAFNSDHVDVVDIKKDPIKSFTETGIKTESGDERDFDLVVFATGFDAVSGGITQIDIRGEEGNSIKDKWAQGCFTLLGMAVKSFPNMFIVYGPQAPTAFVTGGYNAQVQGKWVGEVLSYMRDNGYSTIEPTEEAEEDWRNHTNKAAEAGLFIETDSWYFGSNIPGKPREALNYMAGMQTYKQKLREHGVENDLAGFHVA